MHTSSSRPSRVALRVPRGFTQRAQHGHLCVCDHRARNTRLHVSLERKSVLRKPPGVWRTLRSHKNHHHIVIMTSCCHTHHHHILPSCHSHRHRHSPSWGILTISPSTTIMPSSHSHRHRHRHGVSCGILTLTISLVSHCRCAIPTSLCVRHRCDINRRDQEHELYRTTARCERRVWCAEGGDRSRARVSKDSLHRSLWCVCVCVCVCVCHWPRGVVVIIVVVHSTCGTRR
jgi:hypothetical protein